MIVHPTDGHSPEIKVLIVEDDSINALVLTKYLEKDFTLKHVSNGYQAITSIENEIFDVILMDINLGDDTLDGIETTRRIKQVPSAEKTKVFAVTAFTGDDFNRNILEKGFDAYFTKPVDKEKMIQAIYRLYA